MNNRQNNGVCDSIMTEGCERQELALEHVERTLTVRRCLLYPCLEEWCGVTVTQKFLSLLLKITGLQYQFNSIAYNYFDK